MAARDARRIWEQKADGWAADSRNPKEYYTWRNGHVCELILRHMKGGTVLDVGCGTGILLRMLTEKGFDPYGADIAANMIAYTRERLAGVVDNLEDRFRVSPAGGMAFAGQTFDVVACIDAIIYLPDYAAFIRELAARIKPGGYLAISCTQRFVPYAYWSILAMLPRAYHLRTFLRSSLNLVRTGLWSGGFVDYATARQIYSADEFDRCIAEIGLAKVAEMDLTHFRLWDRRPLDRRRWGQWLARRCAWNHIGLYQKPPASVPSAGSPKGRSG